MKPRRRSEAEKGSRNDKTRENGPLETDPEESESEKKRKKENTEEAESTRYTALK
jgi:hypothetical protein